MSSGRRLFPFRVDPDNTDDGLQGCCRNCRSGSDDYHGRVSVFAVLAILVSGDMLGIRRIVSTGCLPFGGVFLPSKFVK